MATKGILFLLLAAAAVFSETHVFWYHALTNAYRLTDLNPGPGLPKKVMMHEGMIASGGVAQHTATHDHSFLIGSGLDDAQGRCAFVWVKELKTLKGPLKKALFRAEFRDGFGGTPFCNAGPIHLRCGVVNFQGNLNVWGGPAKVPANADWVDLNNSLTSEMGFDTSSAKLAAEEKIELEAPAGRVSADGPSPLSGKFLEINVTSQVNFILSHPGEYALVFLVAPGQGSTGKINVYSDETAPDIQNLPGSANPWTRDGNTVHLVVTK